MKTSVKLITAAIALSAAAACTPVTDTVDPITVQTEPLARPSLTLPSVDRYNARPVEWIVVTEDNAEQVFAQLASTGQPVAVFGLSERGYENLSLNTRDALRVIQQQQAIIDGYERYYVEADRVIYEYNRSIQP